MLLILSSDYNWKDVRKHCIFNASLRSNSFSYSSHNLLPFRSKYNFRLIFKIGCRREFRIFSYVHISNSIQNVKVQRFRALPFSPLSLFLSVCPCLLNILAVV